MMITQCAKSYATNKNAFYSLLNCSRHNYTYLLHLHRAQSTSSDNSTYQQGENNKRFPLKGLLIGTTTATAIGLIGGLIWAFYDPENQSKLVQYFPASKQLFDTGNEKIKAYKSYVFGNNKMQTTIMQDHKNESVPESLQWAEKLKSFFPNISSRVKEESLANEELNGFTEDATLQIEKLKRQIAEMKTQEEKKIASAVEEQRKIDEKLSKLHLEIELKRIHESEKAELDGKFREEQDLWDAEIEAQLRREMMAQVEDLKNMIRTQKQLHDIENAKLVEKAVMIERNKFSKQIESAIKRLNDIEEALNSHSAQDLENRRAKIFWTTCQSLLDSLIGVDNGSSQDHKHTAKLNEITFIKRLTENDEFVQSICNCFSPQTNVIGIPTAAGLKERFNKVYKLARRTAQIDENGAGPFEYFLSWLQSFFVLQLSNNICTKEDEIDVNVYDPCDLLSKAKHFVAQGDFETAIRLTNLLRGESAYICQDWIHDALLHLETRYLAELLLNHALVNSIRTTY